MDQGCEIVVTGVGVVSPIGIGHAAFWDALHAGRSGIDTVASLQDTPFPVTFGGEVRNFDGKLYVQPRKSLKVMCREIQFGFSAAALAIQDSALAAGQVDPERFGVVYGANMYYGEIAEVEAAYQKSIVDGEFRYELWGERGIPALFPLWMLKYLPNMTACHIGIAQNALGPNNTINLGEAASLLALIEAVHVLQRGCADVMIVGGADSRLNITPMLYRGHANLSHRRENPAAASRPFDAGRDGMVNGEGAGAFVLETRRHAEARDANIYARVLGCASGVESPTNGDATAGAALRHVIATALRSADLQPSDIGHVNANGLSGIAADRIEAQAIHSVLGDTPVTALKSYFGNLGAGTAVVEMAGSILSFAAGEVPRTLNYEQPDPACPIQVIHGEPLTGSAPVALVVKRSGTGQVAAVVVAAP